MRQGRVGEIYKRASSDRASRLGGDRNATRLASNRVRRRVQVYHQSERDFPLVGKLIKSKCGLVARHEPVDQRRDDA